MTKYLVTNNGVTEQERLVLPDTIPAGRKVSTQLKLSANKHKGPGTVIMTGTATAVIDHVQRGALGDYQVTVEADNIADFKAALSQARLWLGYTVQDLRPRLVLWLPEWLVRLGQRLNFITIEVVVARLEGQPVPEQN